MSGSYDVDHEIVLVQWYIQKVGKKQADGSYKCTFAEIFNDEEAEQIFESLVRISFPFILLQWILKPIKRLDH